MKQGSIKAYSDAVNAGVIESIDGQRYHFSRTHWAGKNMPKTDDSVIFDFNGNSVSNVRASDHA